MNNNNLNDLKIIKKSWEEHQKGILLGAGFGGVTGIFCLSPIIGQAIVLMSSANHFINGNVSFSNPITYAAVVGVGISLAVIPFSKKATSIGVNELSGAKECVRSYFIGKRRIKECTEEMNYIENQKTMKK